MVLEEIAATVVVGGFLAYLLRHISNRIEDNTNRITRSERKQDLLTLVLAELDPQFTETWNRYRKAINPSIPTIEGLRETFRGRPGA